MKNNKTKVALIGQGKFGTKIKESIQNSIEFVKPDIASWIIISTPNDLHYEQVKKWLNKGRNVFCEKPLTLTTETSKELFDLADKMKANLYVDDVFTWHNNLDLSNKSNLAFKFYKHGSFNANIIDNLAYHHFYLWTDTDDYEINEIKQKNEYSPYKINIDVILSDGRKANFNYNILAEKYEHSVEIDSDKINISSEKYPLTNMLLSVFNGSADFISNRKRTLNAVKLCEAVKQKIQKKVLVIGGGIFGSTASVALSHAGFNVTLHEELNDIMQCASNINQYRLHKGYHYPRSKETAIECLNGLSSFYRKYEDSIINNEIEHYYSIAQKDSFISGDEYLEFMKQMGLPFKLVDSNKGTELTVMVDEVLFDSDKLRFQVLNKMKSSNINIMLEKHTKRDEFKLFDYIVIATYAKMNELLDYPRLYQYEIIEKPVVRLPKSYRNKSMVVMDGPFMCFDPFKDGLHVLGHVKHAIHKTFVGESPKGLDKNILKYLNNGIIKKPKITNIDKFITSGLVFFENFDKLEHIGSMFTIRTVLANRDHDDARPTLVTKENEKIYTIFSGKIGTCVKSATKLVEDIKMSSQGK